LDFLFKVKEDIHLKTKINQIIGTWKNVKNKCRTTVHKQHSDVEATQEFINKILISEHSPIRLIEVDWKWEDIPSFSATHWSRHKWECFISSQRTDRTGINRNELPQDTPVLFEGVANSQHLIDTFRKRLCIGQTDPKTFQYARDYKIVLRGYEPELADVLVPNCIYRCGCPEFEQCGYWKSFLENELKNKNIHILNDIKSRYDVYNKYFYEKYKEKIN
jgi:hypothetical protein